MKELVDAISTRIKSPYFGYVILAFFAMNWRGIFLLLFTNSNPQDRLSAFDSLTNVWSLLFVPLAIGALVAATAPWILYVFEYISQKPFELTDSLRLEAEHKALIKQAQLEQSRTEIFSIRESELIQRAKRDEEVANIADEEAKEKLQSEIDELRRARDRLSSEVGNSTSSELDSIGGFNPQSIAKLLPEAAIELLKAASSQGNGKILRPRTLGERSIKAGNVSFGGADNQAYAMYDASLEVMLDLDLLVARGSKGEVFELTHKGWEVSKTI